MIARVREVVGYRELIRNLVIRDLKVRYKNSVLGFFWSLANPLLQVATITIIFKYVLNIGIPNYSAYLLCAFLPWTFFQMSVLDASQSILQHGDLVKKIYFPREIFPLASLLVQAEIQPLWFLAGFLLLGLTSLGSLNTRVPLFLSSRQAVAEVARRLPGRPVRVLDLGCGLGGWLSGLGKARPDIQLAGVEMAPLNWLVSRLRLGGRASVRLGSLWDEDLASYDVVYAYLSPAPMAELWQKVNREMRPGSLFISNSFGVPGIEADETVELNDLSQARLLIWRR